MLGLRRGVVALAVAVSAAGVSIQVSAQNGPVAGRNVNLVGGPTMVIINPFELVGDPFRAQQNEGSCGVSARDPQHIMCGANDYRYVDLAGIDELKVVGDAWAGVFQSQDGGLTWESHMHPGFALDDHLESPIKVFPAVADPVVRMAAGGVGFYSGIAFERGEKGKGVVFVSTWMDLLAREGDTQPFKHVRTALVDAGNVAQFIDKPWMTLGEPISGQTCTLDVPVGDGTTIQQTVPNTPIYMVWSTFVGGAGNDYTHIYFSRSMDCGATFSHAVKLSEGNHKNQGPQIAVLSGNNVVVAWRRGATKNAPDALMVTQSSNGGSSFSHSFPVAEGPASADATSTSEASVERTSLGAKSNVSPPYEYCPFDQGTTPYTFRTTGFSTLASGGGRVFMFWAQRVGQIAGSCASGVSRIVYSSSANGLQWSAPVFVDNQPNLAHQIMPAATVAGDKLQVIWIDFRDDASGLFGPAVEEKTLVDAAAAQVPGVKRHTADIRGAQAPLATLAFAPYPVSQYIFGVPEGSTQKVQLQHNPVNVRMFRKMTVPFISDYLDVAAQDFAPVDPVQLPGLWLRNAGHLGLTPAFAAWTDHRNVKLFPNEDYSQPRPYTRPNLPGLGSASFADPTQTVPACVPGANETYTGSKNQDLYGAAILPRGWFAAAAWNNKPLGYTTLEDGTQILMQRAFAVFARNITDQPLSFEMTIANQPLGGRASFDQFAPLPQIDIPVPAHSMLARSVFVEAPNPRAAVAVDVSEANNSSEKMRVWLNPDPRAPDSLLRPESVPPTDPEFDIQNFEVYDISLSSTPTVTNTVLTPGLNNTGWPSPEWENPEWENPEWENPEWQNPEWQNPEWQNPEWQNPEWQNPEWQNPEWENPEWENGTLDSNDYATKEIKQFRWQVRHEGNTTAAYNTKVAVLDPSALLQFQLVVYKLYTSPAITSCEHNLIGHTQVLANISNLDVSVDNFTNSDWENKSAAHYSLAPGETAFVVLQSVGTRQQLAQLDPTEVVLGVQPQAVNTQDVYNGVTEPPVEVSAAVILTTALPNGLAGLPYPTTTLQAYGGTTPYTWSAGATLPPGLTLNSQTGVISGTPTTAGTYTVVIDLTDADQQTTSATFIVVIESATLTFVVEPTTTGSRLPITPAVQVRAEDAQGAVIPGLQIQIAIGNNPTGATLSGTTTGTTDATGTVTFANLSINFGGTGYTLVASAAGPATRTSDAFNINYPTPAEVTDPTGDSGGEHDLVFTRGEIVGDNVLFTVDLATGTWAANTIVQLLLDMDQNPNTGSPGSDAGCVADAGIIGTDYLVEMGSDFSGTNARVFVATGGCNNFDSAGLVAGVTYNGDRVTVSVPLASLGNDDGRMNFKVVSFEYLGGPVSGVRDKMPDAGLQPGRIQ
jgi:Putative Ig domain